MCFLKASPFLLLNIVTPVVITGYQSCSQDHFCQVQDKTESKEVRVPVKTESKEVRVPVKTESKEVRVPVKAESKEVRVPVKTESKEVRPSPKRFDSIQNQVQEV